MGDTTSNDRKKPSSKLPEAGSAPRGCLIAVLVLLFVYAGNLLFQNLTFQTKEVTWTEFRDEMLFKQKVASITVVNKETAEITIRDENLGEGLFSDIEQGTPGPHFVLTIGSLENFETAVSEARSLAERPDEAVEMRYETRSDWIGDAVSWLLPLLLLVGIWLFILNRMNPMGGLGRGGGNVFDFGKSGAKVFTPSESKVNFSQVAGMEEVKVEMLEIVDFLKNPGRYTRLGAKIPKGVILIGPPGTGKTLLAKAVAGEAGVPFISMSGSEFVEMFVGVGASRVRDLFLKAKEQAPSIIFIDEIDAIGRSRSQSISLQTNDERENTLNQLLNEMDGFEANTGVIVLAATNRGEVLDRALLRPGRFDRQIYIQLPTLIERQAIFGVHLKPLKLGDDVSVEALASQTPGFSGADIANICNEAALIAARHNKDAVEMSDFHAATDRIIAGLERRSQIISEEEKRIIAYHEAGHATASWYLPKADQLLKVSIIPRGKALGAAWYTPEEHHIYTRREFVDRISAALGGRAAEELVFSEISSNALDDLERVTKLAYTMVAYYGLSKELGNLSYYDSTGEYSQSLQKPYSEETARKIDKAVAEIVENAYSQTLALLKTHRDELDALAALLIDRETVYLDDLRKIFSSPPIRESGETGSELAQGQDESPQ